MERKESLYKKKKEREKNFDLIKKKKTDKSVAKKELD